VLFAGGTGPAVRCRTAHPSDGIDFADRCLNTGAMGVRTRGLDIKAGAAKLKAERAARAEAELVVDRWNRRLATGRDMLWSPTIRLRCAPGRRGSMCAGAIRISQKCCRC
jgi:hypothetical protein